MSTKVDEIRLPILRNKNKSNYFGIEGAHGEWWALRSRGSNRHQARYKSRYVKIRYKLVLKSLIVISKNLLDTMVAIFTSNVIG